GCFFEVVALLEVDALLDTFVEYEGRSQDPQYGGLLHLVDLLQYPVVFADVLGIGHIRGEGVATVEDGLAVFDGVATDGFEQIGNLVLREVFDLVTDDVDVGATG